MKITRQAILEAARVLEEERAKGDDAAIARFKEKRSTLHMEQELEAFFNEIDAKPKLWPSKLWGKKDVEAVLLDEELMKELSQWLIPDDEGPQQQDTSKD